jgi:hypothetical protein
MSNIVATVSLASVYCLVRDMEGERCAGTCSEVRGHFHAKEVPLRIDFPFLALQVA